MSNPKPKPDCPFCDFAEDRTIKTGKLSQSLLSNPRLVVGHTLVIPKRHVENPQDLMSEELQEIFAEIWRIEQKMLKSKLATGCDIRQHYRPFLEESRTKVNHLHFHVLPRTLDDKLHQTSMKFELDLFVDLSDHEQQQMKKLLK